MGSRLIVSTAPKQGGTTEFGLTPARDRERQLLREIGALADEVREMRRTNAVRNDARIKAVTEQLRLKWSDLRAMRAPPANPDVPPGRRGGLYR